LVAIGVAAGANGLLIEDNVFSTTAAGDCTDAILLAGDSAKTIIRNNVFMGDWASGCIDGSGAAQVDIIIKNNVMNNLDATAGLCINLHANSTGIVVDNRVHGGKTATDPIDCDKAMRAGNIVTVVEGTDAPADLGIQCDRASAVTAQSNAIALFTVVGKVMITALLGEIDTANIGAGANNASIEINPTAGDTLAICATLDIDGDTIGTVYGVTGVIEEAFQQGRVMSSPVIAQAGTVDQRCDASTAGQIQWTAYYRPLTAGSTMVPA